MGNIDVNATGLNKEQQNAVLHESGPAMIVAGAGTGKTRVITERIVKLINKGVDPTSILAVTFTEKAAGEMLDRVNELRGGYTLDATIATFNGFGDEILREYGYEIGLGSVNLLGETGKLVFMRDHLDEFNLDYFSPISRPDSQLEIISDFISELKQQLISPEKYLKYATSLPNSDEESKLEKTKHLELANAYQTYINLCREHHQIDYDDQIYLTVELLQKRPNVRKALQERFKYILVDEYQDTNPMQSALIDLLANGDKNIFVVGDDDQSIYGWRGATLANILDFNKRYKNAYEVTLIENYRSTQSILDSAYELIQNNNPNRLEAINNLDKKLKSYIGLGDKPTVLNFSSLDAEIDWVANDIASRIKSGQNPGTIAVLARRTATVQKIHDIFDLHALDHAVAGLSNDIYDQTVVRQLIEVLKAVADATDNQSIYHSLVGPVFGYDPEQAAILLSQAKKSHSSLSDLINTHEELEDANKFLSSWRAQMHNISVGQLAYKIVSESGWLNTLVQNAKVNEESSIHVQALSQYFKLLKEFEKISGTASVHQYLDNLEVLRSAGSELHDPSLDISDSKVNVLSVHRSKGLEWLTVYVVDCTEGSFPMRKFGSGLHAPEELKITSEADEQMAEERRLMYVAITRAKQELYLTHADTHTGNSKRRPSRFIDELGATVQTDKKLTVDDPNDINSFTPKSKNQTISLPGKMKSGENITLSVSEAVKWLSCPLDFYYRYVLQVPQAPDPTLLHGTIIHGAIEQINKGLISGTLPKLEDLLASAEESLPTEGYLSAKQRDRAHDQLRKGIELIFDRFKAEPPPIRTEFPFKVSIPGSKLYINGRIDAVYQLDNGIEIRDYKTGSTVKSAEKAKQRATANQQLALYAMAWRLLEGDMPALLSLDFVETGYLGSVKKQAKTIDNLEAKLAKIPESLLAGDYKPGSDHTFCIHPV